jgi:hypothetical protein
MSEVYICGQYPVPLLGVLFPNANVDFASALVEHGGSKRPASSFALDSILQYQQSSLTCDMLWMVMISADMGMAERC